MKARELINTMTGSYTTDIIFFYGDNDNDNADFEYLYNDYRDIDDGSYANPLYHIPEELLKAKVISWYYSNTFEMTNLFITIERAIF